MNNSVGSAASFSTTSFALMHWAAGNHGYTYGFVWSFAVPASGHDISRKGIPDINGDGREDVVISWYGQEWSSGCDEYGCVVDVPGTNGLLTGGTVTAPTFTPVPLIASWYELPYDPFDPFLRTYQYGHFNSDQCSDVVDSYNVYLSACNGAAGSTIYGGAAGVADWNGDGLDDLLIYNTGNIGVRLSTASGFGPTQATAIPFQSMIAMDQDGDGLDDLALVTYSNAISYRLHNSPGVVPDLAVSFKDGYGVEYQPSYVSLPRNTNYTPATTAVYPHQEFMGSMHVVNQVVATDGIGGTFTQQISYAGARKNLQGRGFSGFQSVTLADSRANSTVIKSFYKQEFPYIGMLFQQDLYQNNGTTLISRVVNTPAYNSTAFFPYIASTATDTYEVGGTKNGALIAQASATFGYDNYGNQTTSSSTVTDKDGTAPVSPTYNQTWTTTVTNSISPNPASWCLGLPTQTTVTKSATGVAAITRTTAFTPDYVKCRYTQQRVEPNSTTYKVTTDLGYDSYGNVNSRVVTGINMAARTTLIDWGSAYSTGGLFPVSTTNPEGHSSYAGYDYAKGVQTSQTDANGISKYWDYDNFGRLYRELRPDSTDTLYLHYTCEQTPGYCPSAGDLRWWIQKLDRGTDLNVFHEERLFFDGMDRLRFDQDQILGGSYTYKVHRDYDVFGRVAYEHVPSAAQSDASQSFTYDTLNRVIQVQRPISAGNTTLQTTTIAYRGMTTVTTDPQSKATTKITDPNGWMRRSQDANGYYQNFTYDAFGSLKTVVDSASNALFGASYVYGIGAFQTQTVDMDLGTWNYTNINALGEVLNYTDAKGSAFTMTYDKLSRPSTKFVSGDGTTTWTWGNTAANFNIGQLQSISNTGGTTETYSYDNKGRLSQRQIVSDGTYNYNYTYNATTGLLDTTTYPTSTSSYRLALKYVYQYGLLQQVKDNAAGTIFWQANAMNARGQISQEALGNGIVTNRSFDAVTGWINNIQSGVGGGTGVQNESYLFDKVGNVIQRQNNALGLTESFCYDNVYRLTKSALSGDTTCTTANNLTVTYNNLGNITKRTDVASNATWTYHATKKHAVIQAGSASFTYTYDANGNAITRNGFTVGWNKSNYPTSIAGSGQTASFYYDGNNQRWKQVYVNGSTTETTIYVGGLLEKVTTGSTTDWRHYIKAGGQTVAVYSRQSTGTNTFRYMLEDHQGSVAKITSSTGTTYVSENFSAFGNRRNPATWSGSPTAGDLTNINAVSRKGYTGHDFIGSLGLNHMNGRVQDAVTGRFISADPYITEPGNTQNYNRYSYVYNNPMSFTDPTGFSCDTNSASPQSYDHVCDMAGSAGTGDGSGLGGFGNGKDPGFEKDGITLTQQSLDTLVSIVNAANQKSEKTAADAAAITLIAYRGKFHDKLVGQILSAMLAAGVQAVKEMTLCLDSTCARIDIFGREPVGYRSLFGLEVKTGDDPRFTPNQILVYPHLSSGDVLTSPDPRIVDFGWPVGMPLPPINGSLLQQRDEKSPPIYTPIP